MISKNSLNPHCKHRWEKFFSGRDYRLDKCVLCGIIQTVSKKKTIREYSETDIEEAVKIYWTRGDEWRQFSRDFLRFLPKKKGRLLDVGCGSGWTVAEENRRGHRACGIDLSKGMVSFGKKRIDKNLTAVSLQDFNPSEKFDYVTMNHVFEHFPDLTECLQKIRKLLKPHGRILIAVPNINSLTFRIFQRRWYPLSPWEHIWQFTPETLAKVIKDEGFLIQKTVVNSMSYNPKNPFKKLGFIGLLGFANFIGFGDQVVILAKK